MKLLDSFHCVAILRGSLELTIKIPSGDELATTANSVAEIAHGAAKSQKASSNQARLDVLLAALIVFPFDEWSARRFGRLKAYQEIKREIISDMDLRITSIAWEYDSMLLTHHQEHFLRLVDMAGLVLDDWLE